MRAFETDDVEYIPQHDPNGVTVTITFKDGQVVAFKSVNKCPWVWNRHLVLSRATTNVLQYVPIDSYRHWSADNWSWNPK